MFRYLSDGLVTEGGVKSWLVPSGMGTLECAPAQHKVVCTGPQADPTHLVFHQTHVFKMAAFKKTYKRVRYGAFSFFFSDFSWARRVTCEKSICCRRLLFVTFCGSLFLQSPPPAVFGRVKPQGLGTSRRLMMWQSLIKKMSGCRAAALYLPLEGRGGN